MQIDMSKHQPVGALLRYTAPSVAMMLFTSIYGIVDGIFVSNFAGTTAFAAVNIIMPFIMILGTVGFMLGTGGSALVGKTRGEGDDDRANGYFSLVVYATLAAGVVLAALGAIAMPQVAALLGARGELFDLCVLYGRLSMVSLPAFQLQYAFQGLFSTAGKPNYGLAVTVAAGLTNIALDAVLVGWLKMGIAGAAYATIVSELIGGFVPVAYFARPNKSFLRLGRARLEWRALGRSCSNGLSEMVTSIALSLVAMLYNLQLLAMIGEDGVAAYGVIMYLWMVFGAVYIGYSMGSAPLMSFQYGAGNKVEMRSLLRKGLGIMAVSGICMFAAAEALAWPLAAIFVGYDPELFALTVHAQRLYSIGYLIVGVPIFSSSFFTALNNGVVSATISFVRTLIFEAGAVILLPRLLGTDGIWLAVVVAEVSSLVLAAILIAAFAKRYGYSKRYQ